MRVEQVHGVGEHGQQRVQVVRHDHDRHVALPVQLAEQPDDLLLVAQVEVGQRLVEQQQLGVVHDGLRDRHPLLLSPRQLRHAPVGVVGRADPLQGLVHPRALRRGRAAQPEAPTGESEGDQVAAADRLAEGGGVVLRHVPDPAVPAARRGAEHLDPAGRRREQAQRQLEQSGLAGPVGTDHPHDRPGPDGEGALGPDGPSAAHDADVLEAEGRRTGGRGRGHGVRLSASESAES
jgi:hypothetical protein